MARNQKGFTLIETLVYIALFAIVIGGGMIATYQIIQATDADTNHTILQEEANFLLRKIDWALTNSSTIAIVGNTLTVTEPLLPPEQNRLVFDLDSGNLRLRRFDDATNVMFSSNSLNSINLAVSNLSFVSLSGAKGVKAAFTLTTAQNGRLATEDFSTTKYLRQ